MSPTALATPNRKHLPLLRDQYLTFTAGRTEITVTCVRPDEAYTVTVYTGGTYRIEDQCGSYPTEDMARTIARGYAQLALEEVSA